jgi:hypothetical protein
MVKRAEDILQEAVVYFARLHKLPMFHPVNEGKRSLATGARLKRMGMMSGVSDCMFLRGNNQYSGLFLELKVPPNKPTPAQLRFIELVKAEGYHGSIAYGVDDAIVQICGFYNITS